MNNKASVLPVLFLVCRVGLCPLPLAAGRCPHGHLSPFLKGASNPPQGNASPTVKLNPPVTSSRPESCGLGFFFSPLLTNPAIPVLLSAAQRPFSLSAVLINSSLSSGLRRALFFLQAN